jgi:hypothetical protein
MLFLLNLLVGLMAPELARHGGKCLVTWLAQCLHRFVLVAAGVESSNTGLGIAMRAYELVELSALIAVNGQAFLEGQGRLPDNSIAQYWSVSRHRFDRWAVALKRDLQRLRAGEKNSQAIWRHARPVLEEILTGEMLTRVWTAVACAHDRQGGASYVSPVVRSVFLGHMEARNRALNFMFYAQDHDLAAVLDINRIRHRCERWTDMLLAYLVPFCDVKKVAHDAKRVVDFAEDACDQLRQSNEEHVWQLLRLALRSTFGRSLAKRSPNADLNAQIASSILACPRAETLDATGTPDSLWMERLEIRTADAEAMIEELLAEDGPESTSAIMYAGGPRTEAEPRSSGARSNPS